MEWMDYLTWLIEKMVRESVEFWGWYSLIMLLLYGTAGCLPYTKDNLNATALKMTGYTTIIIGEILNFFFMIITFAVIILQYIGTTMPSDVAESWAPTFACIIAILLMLLGDRLMTPIDIVSIEAKYERARLEQGS